MKRILTLLLSILSVVFLQAQDSFEKALRSHVAALTSERYRGRLAGTSSEAEAAAWISARFKEKGLELLYPGGFQDFSFVDEATGDTLYSQNVVAVIPGYDPVLREEYIVVGAHYDHLGSYTMRINGRDSVCIYPGADANASGVAALLELAGAAQGQHFMYKRSLLFVAFGAGEKGALGAWYFINRAFPQASVKLMINLDRLGHISPENTPMVFCGQPHYEREHLLTSLTFEPFMPEVGVFGSDFFSSDHQAFLEKGIPVCLFTTGMHPYHQTLRDVQDRIDFEKMDGFCRYVFHFLTQAANGEDELFTSVKEEFTGAGARVYAYTEADVPPRFMKGDIEFFLDSWVYKYQRYPKEAIRQGIKGRVMVTFIVEKDGTLTQVEIARSAHPLLDDEALRVISASPKWTPGEKNKRKVPVRITIPVYFELAPVR
ncbi:MAG: TonB family protein [Bacteroidales bacterium]|jgi:TonB family protein